MVNFQEDIRTAVDFLKKGETILYPSDTIWGLGCDATQTEAVEKLLNIKGRNVEKGLIILVAHVHDIQRYVQEVPALAYDMIEFAEKPLTLVLEKGIHVSPLVLKENQSIAIRWVKSGYAHELIKAYKKPLVSTSANISGEPFPGNFSEISEILKSRVAYIAGKESDFKNINTPSTIIRLDNNGSFEFIRR